jgi:hypothetical protein
MRTPHVSAPILGTPLLRYARFMRTGQFMMMLLLTTVLSIQIPALQTTGVAQTARDNPPLQIVAVDIQPMQTAPDTLHRLKVRIRNSGSQPATDLTFQVTVSGQRIAVYLNHSFRPDLQPGKETDVPLYNFWSSETSRPFPKDGRLTIEVRLTSARWVNQAAGGKMADVQPMPPPFSVTLSPRAAR